MIRLHRVGAQLNAIGRCALVGTLVGMLATEAVAQSPAAANAQAPATPETATTQPVTTASTQPASTTPAPTATLPVTKQDKAIANTDALPEAPVAASATTDSASINMPPDLKAMMDDAQQNGQNLTSTQPTQKKGVQRPGMLVLGIAGVPLIILGTMILSLNVVSSKTGEKVALGSAFMAPGAAMSGLGFYFAFHKSNKNQ